MSCEKEAAKVAVASPIVVFPNPDFLANMANTFQASTSSLNKPGLTTSTCTGLRLVKTLGFRRTHSSYSNAEEFRPYYFRAITRSWSYDPRNPRNPRHDLPPRPRNRGPTHPGQSSGHPFKGPTSRSIPNVLMADKYSSSRSSKNSSHPAKSANLSA